MLLAMALGSPSCLLPPRSQHRIGAPPPVVRTGPDLVVGQLVAQGMVGVSFFERVERTGGITPPSGPQPDDLERMATLAGAWQQAFGDAWLDWGLEGGGALGYRNANGRVDTAGGPVPVDVALSLFDLHGGLFASRHLGHRARIFAAAGPLVQFANYWQESSDSNALMGLDQHGSGVGLGYYGRTGIEFQTSLDLMIGLSLRWIDSEVSLGDGLGQLDVRGAQVLVTFSRCY
jgi:hypothetical protein